MRCFLGAALRLSPRLRHTLRDLYSGPDFRRLRPQHGGNPNPCARWREAFDHGGLRGRRAMLPLSEAARLGLDPIVLDHHQAPEILPKAIVVNPNRQDDLSGLGQLCAAGVVFMTLVAVQRCCGSRLFFARQATARPSGWARSRCACHRRRCRAIDRIEPRLRRQRACLGCTRGSARLKILLDIAGLAGPPTPYHLGFLIGPRINAGGRIAMPRLAPGS